MGSAHSVEIPLEIDALLYAFQLRLLEHCQFVSLKRKILQQLSNLLTSLRKSSNVYMLIVSMLDSCGKMQTSQMVQLLKQLQFGTISMGSILLSVESLVSSQFVVEILSFAFKPQLFRWSRPFLFHQLPLSQHTLFLIP